MKKLLTLLMIASFAVMSFATTLHVEQLQGEDFALAVKQIGKLVIKGSKIEFYDRQGNLLHTSDIEDVPVMTFDQNAEEQEFEGGEAVENVFGGTLNYTVYPNPSSTAVMINGLSAETTLRLYNLDGQLIKTVIGTSINVEDVPAGNYLLQCENQIIKIIKQ
ncbi:MAG: T9SS type A sorting domain-containing protein [Paludibacteraceae bacterium]|nr:T9SS type A sorting domain-containing protein [Paludibacteraceae bacterium]